MSAVDLWTRLFSKKNCHAANDERRAFARRLVAVGVGVAVAVVNQYMREEIISHCAWLAKYDRAYAIHAFNYYDRLMPWLELRTKNENR